MLSPIDAKAVVTIDDQPITLRLCFRSIALGEERGVDLFSEEGIDFTLSKSALLVQCLAVTDHPSMTEDEALAVVVRHGSISTVILDLIARFGGKPDVKEGNAPKKPTPRKPRAG